MKLRSIIAALALTLMLPVVCNAQLTEDQIKERKENRKLTKSELNEKATKLARKEAKALAKDGWEVMPGQLPLEKQLDRAYNMEMEVGEDMFPKYVYGDATSIAENYDAGKLQANELAKQNLAGMIQTEITALIENSVDNKQLSGEQAASVAKTISASKNLIAQSIGRLIPVMECYRTTSNKNKEVRVRLAYSDKMAKEAAKIAMREELEQQSDDLHQKLDEIIGW